MERIGFPKPMITERYLVVLEDRKKYILPWTAYLVEDDSRLRRLLDEYQRYKKQEPL
jgi:hypothetical protein